VHWVIAGDANHDAEIGLAWRTTDGEWRIGAPLRRIEAGARKDAKGGGSVEMPEGTQLFAGSVLLLAPETDYELRLTLADADGGNHEFLLKARTRRADHPRDATTMSPATAGRGSANDPFRGPIRAGARCTGHNLPAPCRMYPARSTSARGRNRTTDRLRRGR
jgi:hypothetical protein